MDFGEAIRVCFSKYVDFSGRARRSEYWWFYLLGTLISFVVPFAGLVFLIPLLSAGARRLHDTDRSGWWQLGTWLPTLMSIGCFIAAFAVNSNNPDPVLLVVGGILFLVAIILWIVLTVFMASDTLPGPNRFGPSPK